MAPTVRARANQPVPPRGGALRVLPAPLGRRLERALPAPLQRPRRSPLENRLRLGWSGRPRRLGLVTLVPESRSPGGLARVARFGQEPGGPGRPTPLFVDAVNYTIVGCSQC